MFGRFSRLLTDTAARACSSKASIDGPHAILYRSEVVKGPESTAKALKAQNLMRPVTENCHLKQTVSAQYQAYSHSGQKLKFHTTGWQLMW